MPNPAKLFADKIKARLSEKADDLPRFPAIIGNGGGTVYFGSSRSAVYVRVGNQLSTAICTRVQPSDGLAVWVGYANEERTLYQVLSVRTVDAANATAASGYAPASRYRYLAKGGGQDPLWLELRAWLPLRVGMTSPASTSVSVYQGNIWSGSEMIAVSAQTVDLSSHIPSTVGKAAWVLITVSNTGTIVATKGSEVDIADLSTALDVFGEMPAIPAGTRDTLALVRVYEGQTEIREGRATLAGDGSGFTDIIDLRGTYSIPVLYGAGVVTKPSYTDNGNGTVTIGTGVYQLYSSSTGNSQIRRYTLAGDTFTLTDGVVNYIYVSYNSGTPAVLHTVTRTDISSSYLTTTSPIFTIYRSGTDLYYLDWDAAALAPIEKLILRTINTRRFERESGLNLTDSGSQQFKVASGVVWYGLNNETLAEVDSATDDTNLVYWNGSAWVETGITTFNNTQYQAAGGLATLTANRYAVNWVYRAIAHGTERACILLGEGDYKLEEAQASTAPTNIPPGLQAIGMLVGRIIVEKSATTATQVDSAFDVNLSSGTGSYVTYDDLYELHTAMQDPTGFPNRTDSTWSITGDTLTIVPAVTSYDIWFDGVKHTISVSKDITLADTEGIHLIYFDTDDTLKEYVNPSTADVLAFIRDKCAVALVYWDATNNVAVYVGEERHGTVMDGITHYYLHYTRGLQYVSGLGLGDFVIGNGSLDTHAQFSVAAGSVSDEDIGISVSAIGSTTGLPILYMSGASSYWRTVTQAGYSVYQNPDGATNRLMYNQFTGGAWQLTEVGEGDYVLCHIFASTGKTQQVYAIMGQAEYTTLPTARAGAQTEISSLILGNLPSVEMRPIATVIFQTDKDYGNTINARVVEAETGGDDYIDWRSSELPRGVAPSSHANLTDLQLAASGVTYGHIDDQAQTIAGVKTFSSFPVTPSSAPTTDYQVANKKYVDDNSGGSIEPLQRIAML